MHIAEILLFIGLSEKYKLANERFHVVMDPDYRLLDNNPDIDRWVIDKSLLTDSGDKYK